MLALLVLCRSAAPGSKTPRYEVPFPGTVLGKDIWDFLASHTANETVRDSELPCSALTSV